MVPKILAAGCAILVRANVPLDTSEKSPGVRRRRPGGPWPLPKSAEPPSGNALPHRHRRGLEEARQHFLRKLFVLHMASALPGPEPRSVSTARPGLRPSWHPAPLPPQAKREPGSQKARQEVPPGTDSHQDPAGQKSNVWCEGLKCVPCPNS